MVDSQDFFQTHRARVEACLDRALTCTDESHQQLFSAMRYSTLQGGKRIRPLLVYAASHTVRPDASIATDAAATAVEMIHAYSLIHDDLPAMDDDNLRRGKPTCHIAFDEATAILAGDALQTLAFEHLSSSEEVSPQTKVELLKILAQGSGVSGMVGGQMIDLLSEGKAISLTELEKMHCLKTGALIRASVVMGAISAEADPELVKLLSDFGRKIGLAFQIQDDVLDHTSSTATLGKTQGADAANNKSTYVSLLGLEESRRKADRLYNEALSCLETLGQSAGHLRNLAQLIVVRES